MGSPYALWRLFLRPSAGTMVLGVIMVSAWPILMLAESVPNPFMAIWSQPSRPEVRFALSHLVVLFPIAIGMFVTFARAELLVSALCWRLPGHRQGLRGGAFLIGLGLAASFWAVLGRGGPSIEAMAGAAMAMAWFFVPSLFLPAMAGKGTRVAAGTLLLGAILFPTRWQEATTASPLVFVILGAATVVWLVCLQFSRATVRKQQPGMVAPPEEWDSPLARFFMGSSIEWSRSLTSNRMLPWLHAAAYEAGLGTPGRLYRGFLLGAVLTVVMIAITGGGATSALWLAMTVGGRPWLLGLGNRYPVARRQRGRLAFVGAVMEATAVAVLVTIILVAVTNSPLPIAWQIKPPSVDDGPALLALATAVAWLPVVLWRSVRLVDQGGGGATRSGVWWFGLLTTYMVAAVPSALALGKWWLAGARMGPAVVLVLLAVATYSTLWWATQRHYATADLVPAGR